MGGYRVRRPEVGGKRCASLRVTRVPETGPGCHSLLTVPVALLVLLGASCSSGNDADGAGSAGTQASIESLVTGSESDTRPASAPTDPTTAPTTTVVATTLATTTTVDRRAEAEAGVRAAVAAAVGAFRDCLGQLPKCDVATLEATRRGDMLRVNSERITEWNSKGYAIRKADTFRFVVESVDVNADATRATALVCIADGTALVSPGTGPGGADVIIDDSYISGRELWDVQLDPDGVWRPYAAPASGSTEARDVCPAG